MSEQSATTKKRPHEEFAEQVSEMLKNDAAPWQKPWAAGTLVAPHNPATGTVYSGINRVMLFKPDYADPRWMTLRQANEQGLRVRSGSSATPIVFWQWTEKVDRLDEDGNPVLDENGWPEKEEVQLDRPRIHHYSVFNATQLRLENGEDMPLYEPRPLEWNSHEKAETILRESGAVIHHDQRDQALYRPHEDAIHLPPKASFEVAGEYYSTALHELAHWACGPNRLDIKGGPRGSELYSKQELRAEIASWMLCQYLGLDFKPENSASYVSFWLKALKEDSYEIVRACRDAERIKKYVLGLELGQGQNSGINVADTALVSEAAKGTLEGGGNLAAEKVYLDVPFREKEEAKQLGATWDKDVKKWCARPGTDLDRLAKWLPRLEAARETQKQPEAYQPEISREKVFLQVPYREKDQAKTLGAQWDKEAKLWFAPSGVDLTPLAKWIPEQEPAPTPALDPVDEFAQELTRAGFKLEGPPLMDGQIQRAPVEDGKAGAKDGAYCAHLDGKPNGWFHNHKSGEQVKWVATGHTMSPEQAAALKADGERLQAERAQKRERAYERVANRITEKICSNAAIQADPEHPYLKAKGIKPFGIHQDQEGKLVVTGLDLTHSILPTLRIQTLQTIDRDGKKHFEPGGKKAGAMHLIGLDQFKKMAAEQEQAGKEPLLHQNDFPEILMAEGFATGASLHMATGKPVAVAFDAGNLKSAAIKLREKYKKARIIICADNDHQARKNVGLEKAQDAAKAVQGQVLLPDFTEAEKKKGLTDFNDLHRERGLEAVAALVNKALERPAEATQNKGMER